MFSQNEVKMKCVFFAVCFRPITAFSRTPVSQVACGSQHSVVYTWGVDSRGQLGLGKKTPGVHSPEQVRSLCSVPVVEITAGGEQSFGLSVSGSVFSWGRNHRGQLGLGHTEGTPVSPQTEPVFSPTKGPMDCWYQLASVICPSSVRKRFFKNLEVCLHVLTYNESLTSVVFYVDRHTPTHVHSLDMKKTVHVSCGEDHTAVLTKDGAVFTFGSGQHGQLGHNSFRDELRPRLVAEFWGSKVTQVACGRYSTLDIFILILLYWFKICQKFQILSICVL
uniref:Uncharacterized protein n=1 Tax=Sphaeramia orbicularis TaxID=375764 RepID=A0A673CB88_9TELE